MPWDLGRLNALVPQSWDESWTSTHRRVVLNQKPSAWQLPPDLPPTPLRAPFGEGNSGWQNPTTTHSVPLNAQSSGVTAILTSNNKRNLLILQNGSSAVAPDVAPNFYFAFQQTATINQAMVLPPGVGIVLDIVCPRDAVYLTIGPSINGGGTVVVTGIAVEGALSASS